jgi:hypothetical protein
VNRTIPDRARRLAAELELRFTDDAALATELNEAQRRLGPANDRLWSGLHPDGMAVLYGACPAAVDVAVAQNRSEILGAAEPFREIQEVHWTINGAFGAYQAAAEHRRQLGVEVGELSRELVATPLAAGWSEEEARDANLPNLANAFGGDAAG